MKKNDAKFNGKKKKKKRLGRKATEINLNGEDDEYGIEDEEESGEDEDEASNRNDKKISAKSPLFKSCCEVYEILKQKFPQLGIDGEKNVWILKPAGSSRGRGICLYKNLVEILDVCK
jgi:tubulin monoglycylase TTLL3/8